MTASSYVLSNCKRHQSADSLYPKEWERSTGLPPCCPYKGLASRQPGLELHHRAFSLLGIRNEERRTRHTLIGRLAFGIGIGTSFRINKHACLYLQALLLASKQGLAPPP